MEAHHDTESPGATSPADRGYLKTLLLPIREAFETQTPVTFRIEAARAKGFSVKVGGLYAYIPYSLFAWHYPEPETWQHVEPYLKGQRMAGMVTKLSDDPISITLSAKMHTFEKAPLVEGMSCSAIVLNIKKYGYFLELGRHFQWKYGSLVGLAHFSDLEGTDYNSAAWQPGAEVKVPFAGLNEKGQPLFGNADRLHLYHATQQLPGSILTAEVMPHDNNGFRMYRLMGQYPAQMPITKGHYPDIAKRVRKAAYALQPGDTLRCQVLGFNKRKDALLIKWLDHGQDKARI